ncbi:hypothetical protein [Fontivita pretiosa]|uniref:hypothetical protein n=1 Tax=Fontivita pretiosa TaxID=2989684 RepID=UPI003D16B3C5
MASSSSTSASSGPACAARASSPTGPESALDVARGSADTPAGHGWRWAAILLLILGFQIWLLIDQRLVRTPGELLVLLAALALPLFPPVRWLIESTIASLRRARGTHVAVMALVVLLIACAYFYFTAVRQQRFFFPIYQDEFSYQIQAQMLARGRLWMPMHPLADFFDSFYVIVDPVYSSMYFPGTALLLAPGVWLGLPSWVVPLVLAGATVAIAFVVFREALGSDTAAGALAALLFIGLSLLRMLSLMSLSNLPALMLGLVVVGAWLGWRRRRAMAWLVLLGGASGCMAITRPVDALCYAVPVGIMLLCDLRSSGLRAAIQSMAIIILCAAPFLAVQLAFNRGVTGRWLTTPFRYYTDRDYPNVGFGFATVDPNARPVSQIPQKQAFYRQTVVQLVRNHRPAAVARDWLARRLPLLLRETLPDSLLLVLATAGVVGLRSRRHWPFVLVLPMFVLLYSLYPFFLVHYVIIVAPAVVLLVLLAWKTLPTLWPGHQSVVRAILTLLIIALTIASLPEFHRTMSDSFFMTSVHPRVNQTLARLEHKPAVVLFRYAPGQSLEEEPVYNFDVAWPDDAQIIRAHDLGPTRNIEIFRYYAQRQPNRAFYLYDRADDSIRFLGFAPELARGGEAGI